MQPVSIRFNNPGALNTAGWVQAYPGYVSAQETTPGNHTARFDTMEHGVAAYWELLRRYREKHVTTVGAIITQYGGGQDYSTYLTFVCKVSGLLRSTVVLLSDDATLIKLAKAMWHYEAGKPYPITDEQIIAGFNLARAHVGTAQSKPEAPVEPPPAVSVPEVAPAKPWSDQLPLVVKLVARLFGR